ncbi:MAG: Spx/MgsR family RNA polymerase-binding regulatory protein [Pseudomonadota bacterium]
MKLYHYPNCSTCKKAIKYLAEVGKEAELIDIAAAPPSTDELLTMLSNYNGELKRLFNTSGQLYRQLEIKDKLSEMSTEDALALLADNGMLVKRPFLLVDSDVGRVGFKPDEWDTILK